MISLDTLQKINDIVTILNNTRKQVSGVHKPNQSFQQMINSNTTVDPIKQSEIAKTTIMPDRKPIDTSCVICGKPGKYMIGGSWRCEEHRDTVLSDALFKNIQIKKGLINGIL